MSSNKHFHESLYLIFAGILLFAITTDLVFPYVMTAFKLVFWSFGAMLAFIGFRSIRGLLSRKKITNKNNNRGV